MREVESHPVALAQCERFFANHPHIVRKVADDTAGSVQAVINAGDRSRAAIAGSEAAELYGGSILLEHIEDFRNNFTRFALLSPAVKVHADNTTSTIALTIPNRPGSLYHALAPFANSQIDLLSLVSRPIKGKPWQYRFFLDVAASKQKLEACVVGPLQRDGCGIKVSRVLQHQPGTAQIRERVIMLVSMRNTATREDVLRVVSTLQNRGIQSHVVREASRIVVVTNQSRLDGNDDKSLRLLPAVDSLINVTHRFKLASIQSRKQRTIVRVGEVEIGGETAVVIAGPCSVESREQLMAAARGVRDGGATMLRGGAYKPRTSPYEFQGLGVKGLKLLAEAREEPACRS